MKTKFIPFDLETMDQALSFKTTDGDVVTQITYYPSAISAIYPISCAVNSTLYLFDRLGVYECDEDVKLLMEVEDKIEFPCLCYVNNLSLDSIYNRNGSVRLLVDGDPKGYTDNTNMVWKYVTPLTKDEAANWLKN